MPLRDGVEDVVEALTVVAATRAPTTGHFSGLLARRGRGGVLRLHVVEEDSGGLSLNIFDIFKASSVDAETTTYANTITIKLRNIAFAKNDELIANAEGSGRSNRGRGGKPSAARTTAT